MKVCRVSEMRDMDRTASERFGIREDLLMENAGLACTAVIQKTLGVSERRFVIFCAIGNNGGDGLVVARKIHSDGGKVTVFLLGDPAKFQGPARLNYEISRSLSLDLRPMESLESAEVQVNHCDAIVDAIFGTGLSRDVEGLFQQAIEIINRSGKTVYSVDIPSGINGDTGRIMGVAVQAHHTVTFGLPKVGNLLYPGFERCGRLHVTHISFPPSLYESDHLTIEINEPLPLPTRKRDAHKGSVGDALFIAGASGYYGAPLFSALSFLKAGGGYSRLAAPCSIIPFIAAKAGEVVYVPQRETGAGSLSLQNLDVLLALSRQVDIGVLGPGISLNEETQDLARELAGVIEKPLLLDGDGITAISGHPEIIRARLGETVLTPHLGEMARMTGRTVSDIEANKIEVLQETARHWNAILVLKGPRSLIGYPDGRVFINMTGNPGMATAGSGDVLTGTIAAMFGLGLSLPDAVRKGVFIHGLAGDLAAQDLGEDGMTAQDILDYLPLAMRMDREGLPEALRACYEIPIVL